MSPAPNARPRKKPSRPLFLTIATPLLLIGVGTVAYWFLANPRADLRELPTGATLVPESAAVVLAVATDTQQWQQLQHFGTPESQTQFQQMLQTGRDRWLGANGILYDRDIQPWVGTEATLALVPKATPTTPAQRTPPKPKGQDMMLVLPIADAAKAQASLTKVKGGGQWAERIYQGIPLYEQTGPGGQGLSIALIKHQFIVLTTSPQLTNQAIEVYQGGDSLAHTPGYRRSLDRLQGDGATAQDSPVPTQAFAQIYLNIPALAMLGMGASPQSFPNQAIAQLQESQGVAAKVYLETEGIRFKGISWLKPDSQQRNPVNNEAKTMPDRLPGNTLFMVSGGNLQKLWQDYALGAQSNPNAPIGPDNLRMGIQSITEMDLEKDWLNWMAGEFALALVPPTEAPSSFAAGLVLLVKASDRRTAEASLQKLDQVVQTKYQFQVQGAVIGNLPVTQWTPPYRASGLTVTHGWLDNDVAFVTLGPPIASTFVPFPKEPLTQGALFQGTVPRQPNPSNGHFFIDVDRTLQQRALPLPLSIGYKTLFQGIEAIGVTAAVTGERSTRYDVFVKLHRPQ